MTRNVLAVCAFRVNVEHIFNMIRDICNWWCEHLSAETIWMLCLIKYYKWSTLLNDPINDDDNEKNVSVLKTQVHEIIVLNELTITDDEKSYEFMKTLWQWAAAAKCSVMSVDNDNNSESDNIEADNLKTDKLAELDQRKTRAEQSETSDIFVVIDDVSESSEQSDTAVSSSLDDLITSSSAVWKI